MLETKPLAMLLSDVFPPQKGGSGTWFWEIYRRQQVNGYVMAVGNSKGIDAGDSVYPQHIERVDLSMGFRGIGKIDSIRHYIRQVRLVRKLCSKHKIRMIHAARPLSEGLVARLVKLTMGTPYLCYVHGEDINIAMTSRELRLLTKSVLSQANAIIANSTFTRDLLLQDWSTDSEKIVLMNPGVDTDYFVPAESEITRAEHWKDKTVLLTVGRLQQRKGHDTVIRAVADLNHAGGLFHYVIVGDGEERKRLQQLAKDLDIANCVEFVGEVDNAELLHYLQICDVFILANRTIGRDVEGFGIVLLEAQACGKPVIAGNSGGTRDTMLPNETGYLIDCNSPVDLVDVLRGKLSSNESRSQMGRCGRDHVVKNFCWQVLASKASTHFRKIL